MQEKKGEIETDKLFALLLGVVALALIVFLLMKWTGGSVDLFESIFK